ncbi:uncharacterized protein THITE_2085148 [Thermothielavioides terrestris NRRL 8126]|uniref:Uncharacterized protein n=1 Tax=Thermothielavioides terrestris (strain ATCC 38088 / NRRL 8126) TaxID=578455 RepID=G2QTX6_THETT|nr:uncharacterized protein THITE_2085148 [Thermothielavioides terrestris NRRL 8126]AEO63635.1 hypothetical protein THITE_2085148 [Thermothielavioides terrestris NRRL 8126]
MATVYPPETTDGVVTSWVPLTTIFTPSLGCESKFRLDGPSLVAYDPGYGLDIDSRVKCAPPAVTTWWEQGRLGGGDDAGHTAVSLGPLTCPSAWTTVASWVRASSTQVMCCPPDYFLAHGVPGSVVGDCLSSVTKGAVLTFASTPPGASNAWSIATTTLTGSSTVGAIAVVGWNIALQTSKTSFTSITSTTSSSTSTSTFTSTATTTSPFVTTATSSGATAGLANNGGTAPSGSSPGLTTGGAVGLGVGVSIGVLGLAALLAALYLIRSRRQKAEAAAGPGAGAAGGVSHPPAGGGLPPPPPSPTAKPAEVYATHELASVAAYQELPASQTYRSPHELA